VGVYLAHMNYEIEDIQGLMNDLSTIGQGKKCLVYKKHYGFGEDLQGVNDGVTPLYITNEGADLMHEAKFGRRIKETTLAIIWSNWEKVPGRSWTETPLPAADLVESGLYRVGLFQSSPRMHFPGELPPERVKMAYEILLDQILKIKFEEE